MKKVRWLSAAAGTAIVAFSLAMPTAAYAASGPSGDTTGAGNLSLLNGNGINLPVSIPVDLCGVGVGILGSADNTVGGTAAAAGNVISGNVGSGLVLDLPGQLLVALQEDAHVVLALADPVALVGIPGAGLLDDALGAGQLDDLAFA